MEKVFVVKQVANKLMSTEAALDAAMVEATELMGQMLQSQRDLNLSPVVTAAATAKLVDTIAALSEARSAIVGCHSELNELKLRIGVRTRMAGWQDKPEAAAPASSTELREVG